MHRRRLLSGAGTVTAAALAGCVDDLLREPVTQSFSDSYAVSGVTTVSVSNRNGPVSIRRTSGAELTVSGETRAATRRGLDSVTVDVVEGETFVVTVRFESGSEFSNRRVDLTVEVPEGVAVDSASTANGDVTVENVRGDLATTTANGTVQVTDVSGYVRGETANGNVRIRGCRGVTGARSTNGNVDVRVGPDVSTPIRFSTNSGTARVRDLPYTAETERRGYLVGSLLGGTSPLMFLATNNGDLTLSPA